MKSVHGAALRRNTFFNNSTASIEVVTSSPNPLGGNSAAALGGGAP
jgi:hypothetical protein